VSSVDLSTSDPRSAPADGEVVRLLVTASQKTQAGDAVTGQFALTMTSRGGRWEVSGLDSSPLLLRSDAGTSATPTSTAPVPSAPASTTGSSAAVVPAPSSPAEVPLFSVPGAGPSVSPQGE
jgi:hypothetical protein